MAVAKRRNTAWAVAGGVLAICAALLQACTPFSFVKSVQEDHGTFYRLKVKLAYKGEKQDFDIVVACNGRVTTYKDNSSSYDPGMVPPVFGRRMSDGKGLVVRPPLACEGETSSNGKVPPDLLPVVVVYDDADTLDFGTAYLSEDAYESPLSLLKFGGATIEKASEDEFVEFRRTQPNLVRRDSYWSALAGDLVLKRKNIVRVAKPWANECQAYERFRIPEQARAFVREHWPKAHPRYWIAQNSYEENALGQAIMPRDYTHVDSHLIQTDRKDDPPRSTLAFAGPDGNADLGLPTRDGGGILYSIPGSGHSLYPPAFYPALRRDYLIDVWPADPAERVSYIAAHKTLSDIDIDFRAGKTRGFAYCAQSVLLVWRTDREAIELIKGKGKRAVARIAGQDIPWTGQVVNGPGGERPFWIFEHNDYAYRLFYLDLESRGEP